MDLLSALRPNPTFTHPFTRAHAQDALQRVCGKDLSTDDIDLISERFEIGGRVHVGHFMQVGDDWNISYMHPFPIYLSIFLSLWTAVL